MTLAVDHPSSETRKVEMPMEFRLAPVSAIDAEKRTIEVTWTTGATVRRSRYDWMRDRIIEFDETLVVSKSAVNMERLQNGAPALDSHSRWSTRTQVGVIEKAWLEGSHGRAIIRFPKPGIPGNEAGDRVAALVEEGIIRNISVGYSIDKMKIEPPSDENEVEHRTIERWTPHEISFVTIGADAGAQVRDAGFDETRTFPVEIVRGVSGDKTFEHDGDANMPDGNQPSAAATMTRDQLIDDMAKRHRLDEKFVKDLRAKNGSIPEAREAVLEELARRDAEDAGGHTQLSEPGMTSRSLENPDFRQNAMAGAIVQRMMPNAKNLPEGWQAYRGWSFVDMAAECLERDGVRTRGMRPGQIVQTALGNKRSFHTRAGAAYGATGSGDFIGTIGDAGRQFMQERYRLAEPVLKMVAREMSFTDYREHQSIRGSGFPKLDEVSEHGEIKHGHLEDAGEKMKLVRYGKIVGLTHQALINDKVGQFADLMSNASETAIAQESTLLAEKLEENPALADGEDVFSAAHNNLAGSGAPPDESTLSARRSAMRKQLGLNNQLIAPTPKYLLVPTDLETTAEKLVAQITAAKTDDANVFTNLTPLVEPRLQDQFAWYLAADPAQTEGLRYGYLESEGGPVVDERYGWEIEGIEVRVRLSFAAGWVDFRGWQKNPGQ